MQLYEEYRPKVWADVVGQEKALAAIACIRARGLAGRSYWISGASGTGKTTIAKLLADEVASEWAIEELDAKELNAAKVREWARQSYTRGMGKGGRAYIVNEAHGMTASVITQLLTTLERVPAHVVWIFTTTTAGQLDLFEGNHDAHPLLSRCVQLALRSDPTLDFAIRARKIAQEAGCDGQPFEVYVSLVKSCRHNLREVLQRIESGVFVS